MIDRISENEINDIIEILDKEIDKTVINWKFEDGVQKFKVDVKNKEGYPLKLVGTYSHKTGNFSFALLLGKKRIRGLDCGHKPHHNPDCQRIKGPHKHRWTDAYQDREAYVPKSVNCTDIIQAFRDFLKECKIIFKGTLKRPFIPSDLDMFS